MISVVIPVKNGGMGLVWCLEGIARQQVDEEVEVVVVDSGSSDGSPGRARRLGARVHPIPPADFHHGRTRNLGAELAHGEVLVFTTQDAYPADESWLASLVAPLRSETHVAGVYGRQVAHEGATPPEQYFLEFLYGPEPRRQRIDNADELTYERTLFSNVNSAMRRETWRASPFADDLIMSEDQEWARRTLLAGLTLIYEPRAAVRHSHAYTLSAAFRRFFDSGVSANRTYVSDAPGSRAALRRAAMRYAVGELIWLWTSGQRRWIPYATSYELAKFIGLQLGLRHQRLPRSLNQRFSALPSHWDAKPRTDEVVG